MVLEVEEIYSDVWKNGLSMKDAEMKLIESADSYIFVSDLLKERLNNETKKSIVLYGSYYSNDFETQNKECNSPIEIVYAGSVERIKGGAFNAINTMRYLTDNYILYILGHGSDNDINELKKCINEINAEKKNQVIKYLGTLHGDKYSKILNECKIAINPQNIGEYMNTAFPSKIISYLSHNLHVVTTRIKSIEKSSISNLVTFSEDDDPKNFAKAIKTVDIGIDFKSSEFIEELHKEFLVSIKKILEV